MCYQQEKEIGTSNSYVKKATVEQVLFDIHDFIYSLFSSLFLPHQLLTFVTLWHEVQGYTALSHTSVERNWLVINKNCKTNPTINPAFGHDLCLLAAAVKRSPQLSLNFFNPGLKSPCAKVGCRQDFSSQGWEMHKCCSCSTAWNGSIMGNGGTWHSFLALS